MIETASMNQEVRFGWLTFRQIIALQEIGREDIAKHFGPFRDQGPCEFRERHRAHDGLFRRPALHVRVSHIPIKRLFLISPRVTRLKGTPRRRYALGDTGGTACDYE